MNNRAFTLSLVMAAIAVFFVYSYVTSIEEEAEKKYGTTVQVVVAGRDLKEMETIDQTMLELKKIPKRFLEPNAVSFEGQDGDDSTQSMKKLVGTIAMVPIKKGEQITINKITEPSIRTGLAPQVTPGRRAVSILVNEQTGVGKLVKPGDRVDVVAVFQSDRNNKLVKTILQDVVVLAVGRAVTNNAPRHIKMDSVTGEVKVRSLAMDDQFNSITIEVEPSQAQALALVQAGGETFLTLALRNNDDSDRIGVKAMTYQDVLGGDFSQAAPRQPAGQKK